MPRFDIKTKSAPTRFKSGQKQVEIASKGGKASGVAKREKKALFEALQHFLTMPSDEKGYKGLTYGQVAVLKQLKSDNPAAFRNIATLNHEFVEKTEVSITDSLAAQMSRLEEDDS